MFVFMKEKFNRYFISEKETSVIRQPNHNVTRGTSMEVLLNVIRNKVRHTYNLLFIYMPCF